ncbi:MAG TPA: PAS domain-containing protein [Planctomycetota bacterium]
MMVADNPSRPKDVVVFVDDQPEILDALRRILRDESYEVRTTSSPDEALRWVGEGVVSVLVTDERMPTMRGTELLEHASKRSPKTVRVVLTGYPGSYTLHYGLSHGVDWLISKPWNDEALKLTVRQLLDDRGRKRRAQERIRTPRDFQEICETLSVPLFIADKRGDILWANPALLELVDRPRKEVVGRPLTDLYADPEAAGALIERLERRSPIRGLETRLLGKEGNPFLAVLDSDALWEDGTLIRARPLSPRESEESFRLLVEGVKDSAIFMLDPEGVVSRWNAGAKRLLGYDAAEIAGKPFSTFFRQEDVDTGAPRRLLRAAEEKGGQDDEGWRLRKDGAAYWSSGVVTALREPDGSLRGFSCVTRDMTERRRAEEERQRLNAQMLQGQKLQAIGQLSAGIAHEINTPVGYILSNLTTMREYVDDLVRLVRAGSEAAARLQAGATPAEAFAELEEVKHGVDFDFIVDDFASAVKDSKQGAERIRDIVKSLREFAHVDEGKIQPTDLVRCLEDALKISWNELKYKTEVERDFQPLPPVPCSCQRMEQVFVNLLVNAGQAIPKKGTIRLSTRVEDGHAVVRIADTGVGMTPDVQKRIFEPFFTTKPVGAGTGLGLHVAYRIVSGLGGRIDVRSEPGKGTEFAVRLPLVHPPQRSGDVQGEPERSTT